MLLLDYQRHGKPLSRYGVAILCVALCVLATVAFDY